MTIARDRPAQVATSGRTLRPLANPITSEVQYTDDERQFMVAMDEYKRANERLFPSWREVLAVLISLGWRQVAEPTEPPRFKGRG